MSKVRVTSIPGVYSLDSKAYGPFEATGDKAFVEVPTELAELLSLPVWPDPDAPEPEPEEAGASVEDLLEANHTLKADLNQALAVAESNREGLNQMAAVRDALTTQLAEAKARIGELEGAEALASDASTLPADARERLIEIPGIGEKLADKVLEALAAPEDATPA